jgi:translation initiation factor eIF-2B subunit beta
MALALSQAGIDTTVISDSAIFAVMSRVNKVILGTHAGEFMCDFVGKILILADAMYFSLQVLANGGLVAVNGSSVVAAAAKHHSTPVVVLTELYKLSAVYPFDTTAYSLQLNPDAVYSFEDGKKIYPLFTSKRFAVTSVVL